MRSAEWARRSLEIREAMRESDDPEVAKSLVALGQALLVTHQSFAAADSVLRRALAIREAHFGVGDTLTASVVFELGRAAQDLGREAESVRLHERALAIREKVLGADHADTLARRTRLAHLYYAVGRVGDAHTVLRDTVARCERVLPHGDPLTHAVRQSLTSIVGEA